MRMINDLFATVLDCAGRPLRLDRPRVVGILNVTPDSFSDGGQHAGVEAAVAHGLAMVEEGADMLDVGGESTRPGADEVSVDEELARVIPVIEQLAARTALPIAIDTSKPEVMRAAVAAGAGMINDVYALRREGAMDAAAELGVPVCLMHMQGEPRTMQAAAALRRRGRRGAPLPHRPAVRLRAGRHGPAQGDGRSRASASARRWSTIWRCCARWSGSPTWAAASTRAFRASR